MDVIAFSSAQSAAPRCGRDDASVFEARLGAAHGAHPPKPVPVSSNCLINAVNL